MTLSVLQLNINGDNYWDILIPFLTSHNFDIITMQEVSGKNARFGNVRCVHDCFGEIHEAIKDTYNGELAITDYTSSDPENGYTGNATFYKKSFTLLDKKEIVMHKNTEPFHSDEASFKKAGRKMLDLKLEINSKQLHIMNVHFAWGPTPIQMDYQTTQGTILLDHVKNVPYPFILAGDFNLRPDQPLIQELNTLANNVTAAHHVTNTLNARTHRAKELFPPGIAVDNIYVSNDLEVKNFKVLEDDISDHLGIVVDVEI